MPSVFIDCVEYVPKSELENIVNKDALRYRWLRDYGKCQYKFEDYCEVQFGFSSIMNLPMKKHGKDYCMDAAIDEAMDGYGSI